MSAVEQVEKYLSNIPIPLREALKTTRKKTTMPANARDLEEVQLATWVEFESKVEKYKKKALAMIPPDKTLRPWDFEEDELTSVLSCASEQHLTTRVHDGIFKPLRRLLIYLGVHGEFVPSPTSLALNVDVSWQSIRKEAKGVSLPGYGSEKAMVDRLVFELKTFWAFDPPENLVEAIQSPDTPHELKEKIKGAIAQIYGYMTVNHLRYGVITSYKKSYILRRKKTKEGQASKLQITPAIFFDQTREVAKFTLMDALLTIVLMSEKKYLYVISPVRSKKKGFSVRIRDVFQVQAIEAKHIHFGECLTRSQVGSVVAGGIRGNQPEESVMKLVDTSKSSKQTKQLLHEISIYRRLRALQADTVIPTVRGSVMINHWMLALVLETCGDPIDRGTFQRRFGEIQAKFERIHGLGVAHGDLKPNNILVDKNGCIRIIDFTEAVAKEEDPVEFEKKRVQDLEILNRMLTNWDEY